MSYKYIKTEDLLAKDTLTYQEILNLKKRMSGHTKSKDTTDGMPDKEWHITPAHTNKGLEYLWRVAYKPSMADIQRLDFQATGIIDKCLRKNCPLGYRELIILNQFDHFTFNGFYHDCNNIQESMGVHNLAPLWKCYDKDGDSFEYYVSAGEMQIVG